jgi:NADH-quinone oxidoreductase subunit C
MNQALIDLGDYIVTTAPDLAGSAEVTHDQLTVSAAGDSLIRLLMFLRDDPECQFKQLVDICGVDWPDRAPRFDVVYHLLSHRQNQRVRIKVQTAEDTPVPSVGDIFSSAPWYEREVWDLYGVFFDNHPDLRRLLTDYGFEGHPLRKDFPLTGYVEVRYDEAQKRVIYEPVQLTQEFRTFDFMSPWEGAKYILPGDEKADDAGGE